MVGTRYFSREVLLELFREEMQMLKEASVIQEWIDESEARERAEGEVQGRTEEARRLALRLLRERLGELPLEVVERVEKESAEWCEDLVVRTLTVNSLQDLGL
jgi:predicted transposase YdaD